MYPRCANEDRRTFKEFGEDRQQLLEEDWVHSPTAHELDIVTKLDGMIKLGLGVFVLSSGRP